MSEIIPPQILDKDGKLVAVLENAYDIGYRKVKNGLWTCQFTLSLNDPKREFIQPRYFVELYDHSKRIGRFIVNIRLTEKNENTEEITYHCDHVLALLHNDVVWGVHKWEGDTTGVVLDEMLALQETENWRLGDVEFAREFHYKLQSGDSLLEAVISVPKRFMEPYIWTWDDSTYPFTLNLLRPSPKITGTVIAGKNMAGVSIEESAAELFTRIYPLGDGEGADQIDITSVNNGVPYLEDADAIERYGLISYVWEDKRYTNPQSLKDDAQELLNKHKQPLKSVEIKAIDYELVDPHNLEKYEIGDSVIVFDEDTEIEDTLEVEEIEKKDVYGNPQDIVLVFGNLNREMTNTVDVIEKDLEETQKEALYKERVYNGVSTSPEYGFMAVRSDNKARTIMNATEGIRLQKGDGGGSNWNDVIYLDTNGNARFTGRIDASEIYGGSIQGTYITADSEIDVGTNARVGNYIYIGTQDQVNKGIVFSNLASISYQNHGLVINGSVVTLSSGGPSGSINLYADGLVNLQSNTDVRLNGISFRLVGNELVVYRNGSVVGSVELSTGVG